MNGMKKQYNSGTYSIVNDSLDGHQYPQLGRHDVEVLSLQLLLEQNLNVLTALRG
jgi:hypothetical protein